MEEITTSFDNHFFINEVTDEFNIEEKEIGKIVDSVKYKDRIFIITLRNIIELESNEVLYETPHSGYEIEDVAKIGKYLILFAQAFAPIVLDLDTFQYRILEELEHETYTRWFKFLGTKNNVVYFSYCFAYDEFTNDVFKLFLEDDKIKIEKIGEINKKHICKSCVNENDIFILTRELYTYFFFIEKIENDNIVTVCRFDSSSMFSKFHSDSPIISRFEVEKFIVDETKFACSFKTRNDYVKVIVGYINDSSKIYEIDIGYLWGFHFLSFIENKLVFVSVANKRPVVIFDLEKNVEYTKQIYIIQEYENFAVIVRKEKGFTSTVYLKDNDSLVYKKVYESSFFEVIKKVFKMKEGKHIVVFEFSVLIISS